MPSEFPLTPGISRSSSVSLIPQCSEEEGGRRSPRKRSDNNHHPAFLPPEYVGG